MTVISIFVSANEVEIGDHFIKGYTAPVKHEVDRPSSRVFVGCVCFLFHDGDGVGGGGLLASCWRRALLVTCSFQLERASIIGDGVIMEPTIDQVTAFSSRKKETTHTCTDTHADARAHTHTHTHK